MSEHAAQDPLRRVRLIYNPVSGRRQRRPADERAREVLTDSGIEVECSPTEGPGHATELAREGCRRGMDAVVAVGGDGTVNEALNGLEGTATALAAIPTGTANMLARELGIPRDPTLAAGVVAAGRRRRIDAGCANGRRFLMVAGVGWDAAVVEAVNGVRKGHLGMRGYVAPIARTVFGYDFPTIRVGVDGGPMRTAQLAFACNLENYAAWFRLAPGAVMDDGLLNFVVLREGGARNYLRWALGAFLGRLPRYREVDCVKGRRIRIESDRPVPFQVDGDPGGVTPLTVELEPGALEVIVP